MQVTKKKIVAQEQKKGMQRPLCRSEDVLFVYYLNISAFTYSIKSVVTRFCDVFFFCCFSTKDEIATSRMNINKVIKMCPYLSVFMAALQQRQQQQKNATSYSEYFKDQSKIKCSINSVREPESETHEN